jgi:membrane-associated protease RseP (regulator of RpoE activity)
MSDFSVNREARRLWQWGRAAGVALLALAVLGTSVGIKALAAPGPEAEKKAEPKKDDQKKDEPKKDEPKPDEPKKEPAVEQPAFPNFPQFPPGADPEAMRKMQQAYAKKMMEHMQKLRADALRGVASFPFSSGEETRLGVQAEKPSAALAEQLDLPKGQGVVVEQVVADSAAAKAGLKANDILLEMDGKPVPSESADFQKQLAGIKADTPIDVLVLRKGKRETLKGLSLPEAKAEPAFPGINIQVPNIQFPAIQAVPLAPPLPNFPGGPAFAPGVAGGNVVMTTNFRTDDRFTTRHQEGSLVITVTGTVADGKSKVGEIHVQDGATANKYESLDKVPDQYRDKVKNLIEMSEKGNAKIEIKNP